MRRCCSATFRSLELEWNDRWLGQFYLHRFLRHQPDLNYANPRGLQEEIAEGGRTSG